MFLDPISSHNGPCWLINGQLSGTPFSDKPITLVNVGYTYPIISLLYHHEMLGVITCYNNVTPPRVSGDGREVKDREAIACEVKFIVFLGETC